jgi:hypothetical protein
MTHPIAVVHGTDGDSVQRLFAAVAADLQKSGVSVIGVTEELHGLADRSCGAGVLRNVRSGERFSIYLETQPAHTSCHLDANGVEAACATVLADLQNSKLVVLSKFGKLEAAHGGLFPVFEAVIAAGTPMLTTVSSKHREAWRSFAPHTDYIDANPADVRDWWRSVAG